MIFNITNESILKCKNCNKEVALSSFAKNIHCDTENLICCTSCNSSFRISESLVKMYCSDSEISIYRFISDFEKSYSERLILGKTFDVILEDSEIEIIKVHIMKLGFFDAEAILIDKNSFKIITGEFKRKIKGSQNYKKIGEEVDVIIKVFVRKNINSKEIWNRLLIQSKEQFLLKNNSLSYLSSAMALESFISSNITKHLLLKGLGDDEINLILKESTINDKLFKYLNYFYGIDFENTISSKRGLSKIFTKRNKLAHGSLTAVSDSDAKDCFRTVLQGIYDIGYKIKNTPKKL